MKSIVPLNRQSKNPNPHVPSNINQFGLKPKGPTHSLAPAKTVATIASGHGMAGWRIAMEPILCLILSPNTKLLEHVVFEMFAPILPTELLYYIYQICLSNISCYFRCLQKNPPSPSIATYPCQKINQCPTPLAAEASLERVRASHREHHPNSVGKTWPFFSTQLIDTTRKTTFKLLCLHLLLQGFLPPETPPQKKTSWNSTHLKINGWNMSSWRFGSDHVPF